MVAEMVGMNTEAMQATVARARVARMAGAGDVEDVAEEGKMVQEMVAATVGMDAEAMMARAVRARVALKAGAAEVAEVGKKVQ
mmetsp:Transcript_8029/g.17721  ORF Transcript_8029/g.17721 Transcript_8029/m.17721 type:complete len:83 (+) Transcript_8029:69-317(+)